MDFTEDIARQRKRSREDCASHSISTESNGIIFSVNSTKPDLKLLTAAYDLLSSNEKSDFEVQFGCIADLFSIVPDWGLFRVMLKFYVPKYGAFVFPQFELVLTIDEYYQFLRCNPMVNSHTFIPKQQHKQFTCVMVQEMLQRICGFPFDFTKPLLDTSWDKNGFNWDAAFTTMGKSLANMRSSQRIKFVALGVYGMVLFPTYVKSIAPMVVALFDQLLSTSAFNPAPTVVAETLRSMQDIQEKRKSSSRFLGCIELFTAWAHGHLRGPRFETLLKVPLEKRKVEDWHQILLSASVSDVQFVLSSWTATHYLHPPEGHHFIPLLGIRGGISYSVELAHRQFGEAQGVPHINNGLPPPFDYASPMKIVDKLSEARELWVKCRMLPTWKENGTKPEYEQWRSIWIKNLSLSWKVTNTKESTITNLTTELKFNHAQKANLREKYDCLALDYELLKRGKELSDQEVMKLKGKNTLLEKDLAGNREACVQQKQKLKFANKQKIRLLQVKADLKAKEEENKKLVEKMANQQKLEEEVVKWKNAYNNLLSNYSALQKELQATKQSKQGGEENTS